MWFSMNSETIQTNSEDDSAMIQKWNFHGVSPKINPGQTRVIRITSDVVSTLWKKIFLKGLQQYVIWHA